MPAALLHHYLRCRELPQQDDPEAKSLPEADATIGSSLPHALATHLRVEVSELEPVLPCGGKYRPGPGQRMIAPPGGLWRAQTASRPNRLGTPRDSTRGAGPACLSAIPRDLDATPAHGQQPHGGATKRVGGSRRPQATEYIYETREPTAHGRGAYPALKGGKHLSDHGVDHLCRACLQFPSCEGKGGAIWVFPRGTRSRYIVWVEGVIHKTRHRESMRGSHLKSRRR